MQRIAEVVFSFGVGCAAQVACNMVDDEPPTTSGAADDPSGGVESCVGDAAEAFAACQPPLQSAVQWIDAGGSMVLVDDPAATVGVGPGGWLVQVASAADFIGSYEDNGGTCSYSCAWCQPGQSFCHTGLTDENLPRCGQCLPYDTPDIGIQCAAVITACHSSSGGSTGSDSETGGLDETGASDDSGDAGAGTTSAVYSCAGWSPSKTVHAIDDHVVRVDASVASEIIQHAGLPLSECDGTKLWKRSDGYFEVSRQADGGVFARMGLERGDVLVAVDDTPLRELDSIVAVLLELAEERPAQVELFVRRGPETIRKVIQIR